MVQSKSDKGREIKKISSSPLGFEPGPPDELNQAVQAN